VSSGIAIVGMACRYPDAKSPAELWENVLARRQSFRRMPAERLRLEDYHRPDRTAADHTYGTEAAVLEGWDFDRVRFKVVGTTFRSADLAHWLALEVAANALADAGFADAEGLPRPMTGVLVGNSLTGEFSRANLMRLRWPYVERTVGAELLAEGWSAEQVGAFLARLEDSYKRPYPSMTEESLAGGLANTIAGRIANHFDLGGGGFTVDGACASSLLAVCQSCSALAAGDLDVALAGGVDLSLDPFELVGFSRAGALAAGDMRVYDRRSAGFIPGEGSGFVVLMRREDALAQGRRIYATLRGWGISSDGAGGITRPEVDGQLLAVERAYRRAGFGAERVGLFEGHGTGTAVGDATELAVLDAARRRAEDATGTRLKPAVVGSIKANIGHTKAAAGVAALIKATLALHHRVLPPATACDEPHALISGAEARLAVLDQPQAWPTDLPAVAAVSAMGFGGINTHAVLEGEERDRRRSLAALEAWKVPAVQGVETIFLSAPDAARLAERVERLLPIARRLSRAELTDLAAHLAREAAPAKVRAALVASTPAQLAQGLELLAEWLGQGETARLDSRRGVFLGTGSHGRLGSAPRVGFLFPGQGSPSYLGGGAWAHRFPTVTEHYRVSALPQTEDAVATAVAQPAIVTASLAALDVLQDLGVEAEVGIGHSLGEIVALCWAGAFDEEAARRIARVRGRAMGELGSPTGAMAGIATSAAELETWPEAAEISIAGLNSPSQTVVSGPAEAVEALVAAAKARGLEATRLKVSHAFHSPLVAAATPRLAEQLARESLAPLGRTVSSTVTGGILPADADLGRLLTEQVTSPVRFVAAVEAVAPRIDLWLEVGPGRVLAGLAEDFLDRPVVSLDAGGASLTGLAAAAGAAWAVGVPVRLEALFEGRFVRPFDLDHEPRFLVNPCELAPLPGVVATAELHPRVPQPSAAMPAAPSNGAEATSPLAVVRALVASRAELPASAVREDSRLLSDLHLNSISVGQLVSEAARALGLPAPASPTDFANATVGEVAAYLAEQAALGGAAQAEEPGVPPGVDTWVRPFVIDWVEAPLAATLPRAEGAAPGGWQLFAPAAHPLASALSAAMLTLPGRGALLCLPATDGEPARLRAEIPLLLAAARAGIAARRLVVVQQGGGGGGLARTLHREHPEAATTVIDVPLDAPEAAAWVLAEVAAQTAGHVEAAYDAAGLRREPRARVASEIEPCADGVSLCTAEDVLVVTGGGKGIGAECALAVARKTGARLLLLGRSQPASDGELRATLGRFEQAGVVHRYLAVDVTDAAAMAEALGRAQAELGPVTGILHSAGRNVPKLLAALTEKDFEATVAPKLDGLANVLAAVDPARLRRLVVFGSIIAEIGMQGEADYASANEWLKLAVERFAAEHSHVQAVVLEWSVWAGVGMGERLGRIEALLREGVTPIPPEVGVELLSRYIGQPLPTVSLVIAGRFGDVPTLKLDARQLPFLRFLDRPRVFYPGIELVLDVEISNDTDPYLADHEFHGERLFPAVMGLEAMGQVAMALAERDELPVFEDVRLERPVVVPEGRSVTIRLAALAHSRDRIEVVLRTSSSGFAADCFRAVCRFDLPRPAAPSLEPATDQPLLPLVPKDDLYGPVCFQQGRFQRVRSYHYLRAGECRAEIGPDGSTAWFGRYLPSDLRMGDPAVRDAAMHGIQACIPHATILPTGVDRLYAGSIDRTQPCFLAARERSRQGNDFVYDLELVDATGALVERWEGLRLRAVERLVAPTAWQVPLLGPYVERRLQELLPGTAPNVWIEAAGASSYEVLGKLLGSPGQRGEVPLSRRGDGKPQVLGGPEVSVSHGGDLILAIAGDGQLGCDLEPVEHRDAELWRDLLGLERGRLAEHIARSRQEDPDVAATRVWTAAECLKKASVLQDAPLVLGAVASGEGADGWVLLRSGAFTVATFVGPVAGEARPVALAFAVREAS
jgi:enediyne polyketide synthase